jgi:signal transduction histidine kinase
VDVGELVDDVVELSRKSGRGAADVRLERQGVESLILLADADQVRQLVWNLVRNAIQASASQAVVRVKLECDEKARLIVEDDGVGIDSEAKLRLFDAFFTTRSQGTGLGLAVVKRIADEHDFEIIVDSQDGEGARFTVHLGAPCKNDSHKDA